MNGSEHRLTDRGTQSREVLARKTESPLQQAPSRKKGRQKAVEAPRGPRTGYFSHHQTQVEGTGMDTQSFVDVGPASKVAAPHAACFIVVSETAFRILGSER